MTATRGIVDRVRDTAGAEIIRRAIDLWFWDANASGNNGIAKEARTAAHRDAKSRGKIPPSIRRCILIGISCRRKASSSLKFDRQKVWRTEVGVDSVRTGDDRSAVPCVGTATVSMRSVIPNTESTGAIDKSCEISLLGLCENFLPGRELPAVNRRGAPRALDTHARALHGDAWSARGTLGERVHVSEYVPPYPRRTAWPILELGGWRREERAALPVVSFSFHAVLPARRFPPFGFPFSSPLRSFVRSFVLFLAARRVGG